MKLTGKDIIAFIKKHHLEDATIDTDGYGFEIEHEGRAVMHYNFPFNKEEAQRYVWTDDDELACEDISYIEADRIVKSMKNAKDEEIMLDVEVKQLIEDKTHEIFCEMQDKLGIIDGDITPLDALGLEKLQDDMTKMIGDVLMHQIPLKSANLTHGLYADVRMNREVDMKKDYLSAGGFTMNMLGKEISFDYYSYGINVDRKDPSVIHIESINPDYDHEQTAEITKEMLENISGISDFFIFTGEEGETDLRPAELLNCAFYLPHEDVQIKVPADVIKNASLGCCVTA